MALIELLGRRWALRILWELRDQRHSFRALRDACDGVSPDRAQRATEDLRESGLVDLVDSEGFGLTGLGRELGRHFLPLLVWSERWARALSKCG